MALQFREKRGDLIKTENGGKNNGLAAKIVYVYEGKKKGPPKGGRRELVGCHYFCGTGSGESNEEFRDGIYRYLEQNYDLEKVKKIYLNADGGSWIKAGMKRIAGVTYVPDGFHLEKYLAKLVSHLKKERKEESLEELREIIRKKTKKELKEEVEKQILSSAQIIHSEKNRHGEVGKYLESITHSVSDQVKKTAYFNAHIRGL